MNLQMIQEGGLGSYAAIAFGGLGFLLGCFALFALLGKSRAAFSLGAASLALSAITAGAGMLGTVYGRHQVTRAVAFVGSGIDMERILRAGFREAQSSSLIGFFAALLPLALGGAAAVLGARLQRPQSRRQGFAEPVVSTDEGLGGQTVVAFIFVAISALACAGAWVMGHAELPKGRYAFEENDFDSWALADALEEVTENKGPNVCERLADALQPYWDTSDKAQWPRKMKRIAPELAGWRKAAEGCSEHIIDSLSDEPAPAALVAHIGSHTWTREALLESPLLQDEALHARLLAWTPPEPDAPPPAGNVGGIMGGSGGLGLKKPAGGLSKEAISSTLRGAVSGIRACYEKELVKTPTLGGKLVVQFTVGPDGRVTQAEEASGEPFPSARVTACVLARFKALRFPKPDFGGVVSVKYPFIFKAAE